MRHVYVIEIDVEVDYCMSEADKPCIFLSPHPVTSRPMCVFFQEEREVTRLGKIIRGLRCKNMFVSVQ